MIEVDFSEAGNLDQIEKNYCENVVNAYDRVYSSSSENLKAVIKRKGPSEFDILIKTLKNKLQATIYTNTDPNSKYNDN